MQSPLEALKSRVAESTTNRILLQEVAHELSFRTTPGAKRLEREVNALLTARDSLPKKADGQLGVATTAERRTLQPHPAAAHPSELAVRYAALRATFTVEAEILSRWGLTSLAPPAIRDAVFGMWRDALDSDSGSHPLGLDAHDLDIDLVALEQNRGEGS